MKLICAWIVLVLVYLGFFWVVPLMTTASENYNGFWAAVMVVHGLIGGALVLVWAMATLAEHYDN